MSNEAVQLSHRARKLAKAKGFGELADDFAQDAYISLANGRKAQLRTLFIDFMRDTFGDSRYPNSIQHKIQYQSALPDTGVEEVTPEGQLEWDYLVRLLTPEERPLVVLHYYWGLSLKEIGYATGVSEGRVSQKLSLIVKNLKKRMK